MAPKPLADAQVAQAYAHITEERVVATSELAYEMLRERKIRATYDVAACVLAPSEIFPADIRT